MGRREPDERPPIELLGADLGVSSTQQVAVGPRRPNPGRGRTLAIAAAVVAVLLGGLALGGRDDDPERAAEADEEGDHSRVDGDEASTSSAVRRTTTTRPTTTTTTLPLGPPLGTPVEGGLLLIGPSAWRVVDLTDGSIRDLPLPVPGVDPYASVTVAGGIVVLLDGEARYYRILEGGATPERSLGTADLVLGAGSDRVWLVDQPSDGPGDAPVAVDVRLVDLSGRVLRSFSVPGRWVEEATADAIILSRGGRVYAADEDGLRAIAVGWTSGTNGGAAVVMTCDTDGSCALRRQPLDGSGAQTLLEVTDPDGGGVQASSEAADGRLALVEADQYGRSTRVFLFDHDGHPLGEVAVSADASGSPPQWLPGDQGLLVGSGSSTQWVRPDGDGWTASPFRLFDRVSDEVMFVITP